MDGIGFLKVLVAAYKAPYHLSYLTMPDRSAHPYTLLNENKHLAMYGRARINKFFPFRYTRKTSTCHTANIFIIRAGSWLLRFTRKSNCFLNRTLHREQMKWWKVLPKKIPTESDRIKNYIGKCMAIENNKIHLRFHGECAGIWRNCAFQAVLLKMQISIRWLLDRVWRKICLQFDRDKKDNEK